MMFLPVASGNVCLSWQLMLHFTVALTLGSAERIYLLGHWKNHGVLSIFFGLPGILILLLWDRGCRLS